ncbi:MAG TPA: hypothetical protein VKJ00_00980 [Thermoanaerobaculia bacterium]|nr:hypothetical protein [Thermoanaerobaculia bacterium]
MSQENVVPFESPTRRAMARRGSADKALAVEIVEMICPYCDVVLCLEAGLLALNAEVLCSGCRTVIDLGNRETMDVGG